MRKELSELGQDLRFSWRQMRRNPAFAAAPTSYLPARRATRIDPVEALREA